MMDLLSERSRVVEQSIGKNTYKNGSRNACPLLPQVQVRMLQPEPREGSIGVGNLSVLLKISAGENSSTVITKATPLSPTSPLDFGTMDVDDDDDEESPNSYEIILATPSDTYDLLTVFTNALSDCLQLIIKEAHVFRSTDDDGMSLGHFVVEEERSCWPAGSPNREDPPEEEDLKDAILEILRTGKFDSGNFGRDRRTLQVEPPESDARLLRTAVEDLTLGDFSIDFKDLEIGARIGGGSSGDIHRGKYRTQNVAVKIINLLGDEEDDILDFNDFSGKELLRMYRREVSTMRLVRHKNLIQFIGACSCWPKLYIVMELMSGNVLEQSRGPLAAVNEAPSRSSTLNPIDDDMRSSVKILRDAARGMDYLHKKGIMHRDLKAVNLLVDNHGVVKVCDFGLARPFKAVDDLIDIIGASDGNFSGGPKLRRREFLPVDDDDDSGQCSSSSEASELTTGATGTLKWIAPEVLMHKQYDHKADVYSFGIVIWEIVTMEVPYADLAPTQAAYGVVYRGLRPVMPPSVPDKLVRLAEQCWHRNPVERPEFSEIATVLEEVLLELSSCKKSGSRSNSRWRFRRVDKKETKTVFA